MWQRNADKAHHWNIEWHFWKFCARIIALVCMISVTNFVIAQDINYAEWIGEMTAKEIRNEAAYYAYPVGKSFWLQSGKSMKVGFYKSINRTRSIYLDDKVIPNGVTKFTVEEHITSAVGSVGALGNVYRIRIDDGTEAYMDANDFGLYKAGMDASSGRNLHLTDSFNAISSSWRELNEKILTKSPESIQATYDATLLADAREREAEKKAELEKKEAEKREYKRKGGVRIGMTMKQVLASNWGRPNNVNRTTTAYSISEQWVYDGSYLYFENGRLRVIQN